MCVMLQLDLIILTTFSPRVSVELTQLSRSESESAELLGVEITRSDCICIIDINKNDSETLRYWLISQYPITDGIIGATLLISK